MSQTLRPGRSGAGGKSSRVPASPSETRTERFEATPPASRASARRAAADPAEAATDPQSRKPPSRAACRTALACERALPGKRGADDDAEVVEAG